MQLKPGLKVYQRSYCSAQVGEDHRIRVILDLEGPGEIELLRALAHESSSANLRGILLRHGGAPHRAHELTKQLGDAGCLTRRAANQSHQWNVPPLQRERLAAEAETRSLVEPEGWYAAASRLRQAVSVYGLGRTGAQLAVNLAAAGLGSLQLFDRQDVAGRDVGQVYSPEHIGMPRIQALTRIIDLAGYPCEVRAKGPLSQPNAAVITGCDVVDPHRADFLSSHMVPHLPIVIGEISITCGPWVNPLTGPCTWCQALWRAEADPAWYVVASQQCAASPLGRRGEDTTLAALAGAHGAAQVLAALAGETPTTQGRSITFSLPDYSPSWAEHQIHPDCTRHGTARLGDLATSWSIWAADDPAWY
ncbi:MAG: hypothetical protein FWD29_05000 [Micrococcales bacterium]|nr:hypothetical protein [Micrococcales bacterium]